MNPYISANEKAQLIRVILMKDVLKDAIDIYASLDSTDKSFLAELRHGRTRIEKAVKLRRLALDNDADDKLLASAAKLEPMFLARPEAKKAHKEVFEMRSTLPMNIDDLQDWYGFVIEFTCKNCIKTDYVECPARRVLTKYEICPVNPGAKDKCQYSYAGTPEVEELQPVDTGETVPAIVYNAALEMIKAKEDSINENYVPVIKQLQAENKKLTDEVEELTIQQIADNMHSTIHEEDEINSRPVVLVLSNGNKRSIDMPEHMAIRIIEDIQSPSRSRSICAQYLDDQFVAIDMQEVVAVQVMGLPDGNWIRPQTNSIGFTSEQEKYWIECRCGAEYFCTMNAGRPVARCRECSEKLFADRNVDTVTNKSDGSEATLLTNRYFVSREPQPLQCSRELSNKNNLRDIKNIGRDYKDPCRLLG